MIDLLERRPGVLDIRNLTRADEAIDALIEKRAAERAYAESAAQEWAESERRYRGRNAAQIRREWAEHHWRMASTLGELAEHHRQARLRLIDEGAGEGRR